MRRFLLTCCFCLLTVTASAQAVDWKSLGRPLDDDSKAMRDRYVYTDDDAMDKKIGTERPILSQLQLTDWVRDHLSRILSVDGMHYDAQLATNRASFTVSGYEDYTKYLTETNLAKFLTENKYKTTAYVENQIMLTNQGLRAVPDVVLPDGSRRPAGQVYVWQITARINISYYDYRNQPASALFKDVTPDKIINKFPVQVSLEIVRIPQTATGEVVAINSAVFAAVENNK